MCLAMPFSARARKKKKDKNKTKTKQKNNNNNNNNNKNKNKQNNVKIEIRFIVVCTLIDNEYTVFDTSVSFTFSSKTLDPLVAKNGSKQVNNTNFNFLIFKLTYVPLPWQHD